MATSNKSKKILEKARKVAAKTKKKKVSKVDVKKKTTSYPEGQNAPQSKRYTQEADKSLGAKNTGWRWTKEGAKKLGKDVNAKPSQSDIETYRNETFKLKGKPNKSGPKGVGDGSHRYLYIERRADKADIKRSQKLAKGGEIELEIKNLDSFDKHYDEVEFTEEELSLPYQKDGKWFVKTSDKGIAKQLKQDGFVKDSFAKGGYMAKGGKLNVHHHDFKSNFTIEWDVKNVGSNANISEDDWEYEYTSGTFTNVYAQRCFDEIKSKVKPKDWHIENWSFAGRSSGWFALICYGDKNDVTDSQMDKLDSIVEKYSKNYTKELEEFYNPKNKSYAKGGYMANGGVVSKQNVQKLLKAVEKDWGQGSELYGDLQESIVGWMNREGELNPQGVAAVKHLLYNWDCYDEYEKYLNSSYAKGGITKDELKEFKSYVKAFYGNDGMYAKFFPPTGASDSEIELAIRMYVSYCTTKDGQWGGGDSFDREVVRDIMLYNRGQKKNLEYERAVKEVIKHNKNKSFEYGGILQPMIGGVNADPRFDIYNTTMFAKDGAMLELGGENPDEKLKVTIHVDVYEDDYEEGEGKYVNSYTVDWLKNPIVKANYLIKFLSNNLYLSDDPKDYALNDDGFIFTSRLEDADGGEASKSEIEKWKKGEMKLYSAHYLIMVEAVGQPRTPSKSELHNVTGIPMYEQGGMMAKGSDKGKLPKGWVNYDKESIINIDSGMIVKRGTDLKNIKKDDILGVEFRHKRLGGMN